MIATTGINTTFQVSVILYRVLGWAQFYQSSKARYTIGRKSRSNTSPIFQPRSKPNFAAFYQSHGLMDRKPWPAPHSPAASPGHVAAWQHGQRPRTGRTPPRHGRTAHGTSASARRGDGKKSEQNIRLVSSVLPRIPLPPLTGTANSALPPVPIPPRAGPERSRFRQRAYDEEGLDPISWRGSQLHSPTSRPELKL